VSRSGFCGLQPGETLTLEELNSSMVVKHRMSRDPITVTPDDTLAHALRLTRTHRIRHLPVCGGGGALLGILSDRDIRLAMPSPLTVEDAERMDFLERTPIAAVMSREVITVTDGRDDRERGEAALQAPHRLAAGRRRAGRWSGIITETDILHVFVQILGGSGAGLAHRDLAGRRARPAGARDAHARRGAAHQPGQRRRAFRAAGGAQDGDRAPPPSTRARRSTALERAGFQVGWPALDHDQRDQARLTRWTRR
jgi:CBS domain-containing protein